MALKSGSYIFLFWLCEVFFENCFHSISLKLFNGEIITPPLRIYLIFVINRHQKTANIALRLILAARMCYIESFEVRSTHSFIFWWSTICPSSHPLWAESWSSPSPCYLSDKLYLNFYKTLCKGLPQQRMEFLTRKTGCFFQFCSRLRPISFQWATVDFIVWKWCF